MTDDKLIVTGASEVFGPWLLGMLGSLDCNWPGHPRVLVYDLGLGEDVLEELDRAGVEVRNVPAFCAHWRKHFTWKVWCWADVPAGAFYWLDAGLTVLGPMDEVFEQIEKLGYFATSTYHELSENASEVTSRACGLEPGFRKGKMTLAGGIIGFNKSDVKVAAMLAEALELAKVEENMAATEPLHRHDQALISLLMYRDLAPVVAGDGVVYGGWASPRQTPAQKVWAHRRTMRVADREELARRWRVRDLRPYMPGEAEKARRVVRGPKELYWELLYRWGQLRGGGRGQARIYDGVRA